MALCILTRTIFVLYCIGSVVLYPLAQSPLRTNLQWTNPHIQLMFLFEWRLDISAFNCPREICLYFRFILVFTFFLHAFTILLSLSFHLPVRWTQKSSSIFELSHHRDVSKRYNWHQLIKVINISINISTSGFLSLPQDDLFLNHINHPSPPSVRVTSRGVAQEKRGPWPEPMLF